MCVTEQAESTCQDFHSDCLGVGRGHKREMIFPFLSMFGWYAFQCSRVIAKQNDKTVFVLKKRCACVFMCKVYNEKHRCVEKSWQASMVTSVWNPSSHQDSGHPPGQGELEARPVWTTQLPTSEIKQRLVVLVHTFDPRTEAEAGGSL